LRRAGAQNQKVSKSARAEGVCSMVLIQSNASTPFAAHNTYYGREDNTPVYIEDLYFRSDSEAQAVVDFLECHTDTRK